MTDFLIPAWPRVRSVTDELPRDWNPHQSLTLVTPFFREPRFAFERSARAVAALDYPPELLEVVWVVGERESGDQSLAYDVMERTRENNNIRFSWHSVTVSGVSPKGSALNAVFPHVDADVVGVVDAAVIPSPKEPKIAAYALKNGYDLVHAQKFAIPSASVTSRIRSAEGAVFHASQRHLQWALGVHVIMGSSIYADRATWELARPFREDGAEESYEWGQRFTDACVRVGFLPIPAEAAPVEEVVPALLQRARWKRGQLTVLRRTWPTLSRRARLLGAANVAAVLARASLPPLMLAAPVSRTARRAVAAAVVIEALRVMGAALSTEYGPQSDAVGWSLLLPWEFGVGSAAIYRALWEFARHDETWHSTRRPGDERRG